MLIQCLNKKCAKATDAKVNKETDEVVCGECGGVIPNISDFTKRMLISTGQILRESVKKPFQMHCQKCKNNQSVEMVGKKTVRCSKCKTELNVSNAVLHAIGLTSQEK